jgi:hypothetical protein
MVIECFGPKKEGMSHVFEKSLLKVFEKDVTNQPFVATKNFRLP